MNPGVSKDMTDAWIADLEYVSHALSNTKTLLNKLRGIFAPELKLYLTGSGNFREQLATIRPYKGNRVASHKPKYYRDITDYLADFWDAEIVNGKEADDALGCAQWDEWKDNKDTTVIVSIDKDLDNIPGYHYNWRKEELYYVDLDTADKHFWTQVITGDTVDNIQGIPGSGPKAAAKILNDANDWLSMYQAVLDAYKKAGSSEAEFHENATLAWIQRVDGINYDDQPYDIPNNVEVTHE